MSQRNSSPILLLLPLLPRYQKLSPIKRKHSLNQHLGMLSLCLYLNQTPKSSAACQHFLNLQHQLLPPDFPVRFFLSLLFLFMTDTNQESGSLFLQFWWVLIYYCIVWFISWVCSVFLGMGSFFSLTQWQELELQALIFRYMLAGAAVPPELLQPIKRSLLHSPPYYFHHPLQQYPACKYLPRSG